jgi:hypothetical protein
MTLTTIRQIVWGKTLGHCAKIFTENSDKSGNLTLEQEKKIEALDRYIMWLA